MATVRTPRTLLGRFGRRCRAVCGHQEGGQVIAFFAVGLVAVLGVAAFVVDVGRFYLANRQLQASSDAVATALANQLPDVRAGTTTLAAVEANAATYGADSSQKNKGTDLTSLSLTFTPKCLTVNGSVPAWCTPSKPNAVQVKQSATVNTVFGKVVGISSAGISATSTAKMGGGKPFPAHVMIVVDRTGSMSTSCSAGGTKLTCAKNGVDAFLSGMDPTYDKVGLAVLPPASNSGACAQPKTSDGAPNDYDVYTNNYVVVGLSNDYKTSSTSPLNPSSTLVSDINCMKAGGTTAYATAIDKAQAVLAANHDPNSQDAIIFFTDGEATYGPCVDANQRQRLRQQRLDLPLPALLPGNPVGRRGEGCRHVGLHRALRHQHDGSVLGVEGERNRHEARRRKRFLQRGEGHPVPVRLLRVAGHDGLWHRAVDGLRLVQVLLLAEPGQPDLDLPGHRRRPRRLENRRRRLHGQLVALVPARPGEALVSAGFFG